jgi:hypothetical protein
MTVILGFPIIEGRAGSPLPHTSELGPREAVLEICRRMAYGWFRIKAGGSNGSSKLWTVYWPKPSEPYRDSRRPMPPLTYKFITEPDDPTHVFRQSRATG